MLVQRIAVKVDLPGEYIVFQMGIKKPSSSPPTGGNVWMRVEITAWDGVHITGRGGCAGRNTAKDQPNMAKNNLNLARLIGLEFVGGILRVGCKTCPHNFSLNSWGRDVANSHSNRTTFGLQEDFMRCPIV